MARKLLLQNIDVPGINSFEVYRSKGGYTALEKALKTLSPEDIVEEVKKSGLRGRRCRFSDRNEMELFGQT
jgi:NADH-quinone oxidoreductase subunit F